MKKLVVLSLVSGMLLAEEPLNLISLEKKNEEISKTESLAEDLAQSEIDAFFEIEEVPTPALEPAADEIALPSSDTLPDLSPREGSSIEQQFILLEPKVSPLVEKNLEPPPAPLARQEASQPLFPISDDEMAKLQAEVDGPNPLILEKNDGIAIDLLQVFAGSPTIYAILLILSVGSFCIWLYTFSFLRSSNLISSKALGPLREKLVQKQYGDALSLCQQNDSLLFRMLASGLLARGHGKEFILDSMKSEGRRISSGMWQKISLLNDIAMIAPMLGLLGTVMGMFYAFYDLNRSMESISALFDGLGISVGTTVAGLAVAILAMMFHSMTKYRLARQLALVENEANSLANYIEPKEAP